MEEFHPGFVALVVEEWQRQTEHRQQMELLELQADIEARNRLEEMKHEFYLEELRREDVRMTTGLSSTLFIIIIATGAAIVLLFLGKRIEGGLLLAPLSASGITAILKHLKNRGK